MACSLGEVPRWLKPPCYHPAATCGGQSEEAIMRRAVTVLDEIMAVPGRAIPASMLADAEGVAVIPNVIKGGFVVGPGLATACSW